MKVKYAEIEKRVERFFYDDVATVFVYAITSLRIGCKQTILKACKVFTLGQKVVYPTYRQCLLYKLKIHQVEIASAFGSKINVCGEWLVYPWMVTKLMLDFCRSGHN